MLACYKCLMLFKETEFSGGYFWGKVTRKG